MLRVVCCRRSRRGRTEEPAPTGSALNVLAKLLSSVSGVDPLSGERTAASSAAAGGSLSTSTSAPHLGLFNRSALTFKQQQELRRQQQQPQQQQHGALQGSTTASQRGEPRRRRQSTDASLRREPRTSRVVAQLRDNAAASSQSSLLRAVLRDDDSEYSASPTPTKSPSPRRRASAASPSPGSSASPPSRAQQQQQQQQQRQQSTSSAVRGQGSAFRPLRDGVSKPRPRPRPRSASQSPPPRRPRDSCAATVGSAHGPDSPSSKGGWSPTARQRQGHRNAGPARVLVARQESSVFPDVASLPSPTKLRRGHGVTSPAAASATASAPNPVPSTRHREGAASPSRSAHRVSPVLDGDDGDDGDGGGTGSRGGHSATWWRNARDTPSLAPGARRGNAAARARQRTSPRKPAKPHASPSSGGQRAVTPSTFVATGLPSARAVEAANPPTSVGMPLRKAPGIQRIIPPGGASELASAHAKKALPSSPLVTSAAVCTMALDERLDVLQPASPNRQFVGTRGSFAQGQGWNPASRGPPEGGPSPVPGHGGVHSRNRVHRSPTTDPRRSPDSTELVQSLEGSRGTPPTQLHASPLPAGTSAASLGATAAQPRRDSLPRSLAPTHATHADSGGAMHRRAGGPRLSGGRRRRLGVHAPPPTGNRARSGSHASASSKRDGSDSAPQRPRLRSRSHSGGGDSLASQTQPEPAPLLSPTRGAPLTGWDRDEQLLLRLPEDVDEQTTVATTGLRPNGAHQGAPPSPFTRGTHRRHSSPQPSRDRSLDMLSPRAQREVAMRHGVRASVASDRGDDGVGVDEAGAWAAEDDMITRVLHNVDSGGAGWEE